MKGQIEPVSAILITGILIGIVGSVYLWGVPLIEKNQDIAKIKNAELFMKDLNSRIKSVANQGGRVEMRITVPAVLQLGDLYNSAGVSGTDARKDISLKLQTKGTIYSSGGWVPLTDNGCDAGQRFLGSRGPDAMCVMAGSIGELYQNEYKLQYGELLSPPSTAYRIDMIGNDQSGGENKIVVIEHAGSRVENSGSVRTTVTEIRITVA